MPVAYIRVIKDIYDGVRTRVKTIAGDTNDFSIDIGLRQGLTLSHFLFLSLWIRSLECLRMIYLGVCYLLTT